VFWDAVVLYIRSGDVTKNLSAAMLGAELYSIEAKAC
jgi:hypothetical protein